MKKIDYIPKGWYRIYTGKVRKADLCFSWDIWERPYDQEVGQEVKNLLIIIRSKIKSHVRTMPILISRYRKTMRTVAKEGDIIFPTGAGTPVIFPYKPRYVKSDEVGENFISLFRKD